MAGFENQGGLGGLGGFFQRPVVQDTLNAVFDSMISSPSNNMMQGFGQSYDRSVQRREDAQQRAAFEQALISAGMDPAQARTMAANPQAAKFALDQQQSAQTKNTTRQWLLGQGMSETDADAAVANPAILSQIMKKVAGGERQGLMNAGDGAIYDPNTGTWLTAPGKGNKPPQVETFYDETTGQPYNAQWNAETGSWDRVGGVKAPSGMSITTNPDGTVSVTQGPTGGKMTEMNSKDMVYAKRAAGALPLIDKLGDSLTSLSESVGANAPVVGNYMKSPQYQQAEQAGKEFLQAILRKDTGAAITAQEVDEYGTVYLPRPGDSPEVLAQKKASRNRALEALALGIPPDLILRLEQSGVELPASGGNTGGWTEMPGGVRIRRKSD